MDIYLKRTAPSRSDMPACVVPIMLYCSDAISHGPAQAIQFRSVAIDFDRPRSEIVEKYLAGELTLLQLGYSLIQILNHILKATLGVTGIFDVAKIENLLYGVNGGDSLIDWTSMVERLLSGPDYCWKICSSVELTTPENKLLVLAYGSSALRHLLKNKYPAVWAFITECDEYIDSMPSGTAARSHATSNA